MRCSTTMLIPGGGSVLHMLRKQVGDKLFFKSLHNYLTTNAHQPVSTEDLRIAFEESSGQSMDWFFDEWLYKMGHPIFTVTQTYDDATKKLTLNVKQTQKVDLTNEYPQTEFFQSWVDVEIDNKIERVWMEPKAENVFTFDVAAKPKLVNWDYRKHAAEGDEVRQVDGRAALPDGERQGRSGPPLGDERAREKSRHARSRPYFGGVDNVGRERSVLAHSPCGIVGRSRISIHPIPGRARNAPPFELWTQQPKRSVIRLTKDPAIADPRRRDRAARRDAE